MGTAAELIKMYPVIKEAQDRGLEYFIWSTGQGNTNFWMQYDDFGLPRDRGFCLDDRAQDLSSSLQALQWLGRNIFRSAGRLRREIQGKVQSAPQASDICLVHGDTFSTVLGTIFSKRLGCRLAHVEAGMRSGDIWNPVPEELNRRWVSRKVDDHFPPDENAFSHLRNESRQGRIVTTGGNTVYDALLRAQERPRSTKLPTGKYAVANLHLFENLQSQDRWKGMMQTLLKAQKVAPVYFVMHPPTEHRLNQDPEIKKQLTEAGVILLPRQSYVQFAQLLGGADFVVTDGGSNQSECAYLGIPCLIMREKTELPEGLDQNCLLTKFDQGIVDRFLANPSAYRRAATEFPASPSKIIVTSLTAPM